MIATYILVASGSSSLPTINHMIFDGAFTYATAEGSRVAGVLAGAGYFNFTLYDVRKETHVQVATYNVEQPKPIVTMK